ncbi:MAG: hypothetical protein K6G36_01360 [Candidatus Saccharibacteria bacterium]|nr:hypothetical protein [Candidatus Saccharibacteria bacterium]
MAKENNKESSILVYPGWTIAGEKKESGRTSNLVLPNGEAARNHHVVDNDDEVLPEITESREKKKQHRAEVKAIQAEQYQEGFESFAKDTQSEYFGLGWKIFFIAVIALAIACAVFSKLGVF